jgi:hypothetical protein
MLAILFMVRLRRLVDGTLGLPGSDDDSDDRRIAKRGTDDRLPSSLKGVISYLRICVGFFLTWWK